MSFRIMMQLTTTVFSLRYRICEGLQSCKMVISTRKFDFCSIFANQNTLEAILRVYTTYVGVEQK